jgi:hypothetical protein
MSSSEGGGRSDSYRNIFAHIRAGARRHLGREMGNDDKQNEKHEHE